MHNNSEYDIQNGCCLHPLCPYPGESIVTISVESFKPGHVNCVYIATSTYSIVARSGGS